MRARQSFLLVSLLAFVGCDAFGPEDVHVALSTDATEYSAPASVQVKLLNLSPGRIVYGPCFALEQRLDAEWVRVDVDDEIPSCPSVLMWTDPRAQRTLSAHVSDPGEYRLLLWVATEDEVWLDEPFATNPFVVVAGAE